MNARILVAENDEMQARLIRTYLEREGKQVQVVPDGLSAIERARMGWPDLLVLDMVMPHVSGLDVCRILRAEGSRLPILVLAAQSAKSDIVLGLDLGADDYLTKPYSPSELTARIRALLRRSRETHADRPTKLTVGDLAIDIARFEVLLAGQTVRLTTKEFAILTTLAREPGRVFTRAEIIDQAFDLDRDVLARTVDVHVMNLRRKLQKVPVSTRHTSVETVFGRGYRLPEPQTEERRDSA